MRNKHLLLCAVYFIPLFNFVPLTTHNDELSQKHHQNETYIVRGEIKRGIQNCPVDEPDCNVVDVDYLEQCLEEMKENHSTRDAMAIMNPSPFTHHEQQELNQAKLEQLELMIKLSKNCRNIMELQIKLQQAKKSVNELSQFFQ